MTTYRHFPLFYIEKEREEREEKSFVCRFFKGGLGGVCMCTPLIEEKICAY